MLTSDQTWLVNDLIDTLKKTNLLGKVMFVGSCVEYFYERSRIFPSSYTFEACTADIDLCIKNVYSIQHPTDFSKILKDKGYQREVDLTTGVVKYNYKGNDIEFLTPRRGNGRDPYPHIKGMGLTAVELKFMELLTHNVISLEYGVRGTEPIHVEVPHPAAYVLHRMVYHFDRGKPEKREKDLNAIRRVYTAILQTESLKNSISEIYETLTPKQKNRIKTFLDFYGYGQSIEDMSKKLQKKIIGKENTSSQMNVEKYIQDEYSINQNEEENLEIER